METPCQCIHLLNLPQYLSENVIERWHLDRVVDLPEFEVTHPPTVLEGGQGLVFYTNLVTDPSYRIALKFKLRLDKRDKAWKLETRETDILKELSHSFIVKILHCFETTRGLFLALEFLDGGSLWNLIGDQGVLPEKMAVYYSACVIDALIYLHSKQILYRDLKAENVVLNNDGIPRLIDFGLSKFVIQDGEPQTTRYDYVSYLAPEIYISPTYTDFKVDSWGIGFLLTELLLGYGILTGIPWQKNDRLLHLLPEWTFEFPLNDDKKLSEAAKYFILQMLNQNPENRLHLNETLVHRFYKDIPWALLKEAKPPQNPYTIEDISYPYIVETESNIETSLEIPKYEPNPNAPTVRPISQNVYPDPHIDMQLINRIKKSLKIQSKDFTRNVISNLKA